MRAIFLFSKALYLPKFVFGLFVIVVVVAVVVFVCVCVFVVFMCGYVIA
jgi:hypothetical protein